PRDYRRGSGCRPSSGSGRPEFVEAADPGCSLNAPDDIRGDVVGQPSPIDATEGGKLAVVLDERFGLLPIHFEPVQHDLFAIVGSRHERSAAIMAASALARVLRVDAAFRAD